MDPIESLEERRRHREWELDLHVAHELASASPAAAVLWASVGQSPPLPPVAVQRQSVRDDGRTTDVQAEAADGRQLLCENKAAGGSYEFRQPESYAAHCANRATTWAISVGPRAWLSANSHPQFDGHVAVEDLAAALSDAAEHLQDATGPLAAELRASYEYRAQQLLDYASDRGYVGNPDSNVAEIGHLYRRLLQSVSGGRLALGQGALANKQGRFARVTGISTAEGRAVHKLHTGCIDVACRAWTTPELRAWYAEEAADGPPPGWRVASDSKGTPQLRYSVTPFQPPTTDPAEAEPILIAAIEAMLALDSWLMNGGAARLEPTERPGGASGRAQPQ